MSEPDLHELVRGKTEPARHEPPRNEPTEATQRGKLVACLLLVPSDAEPLVSLLEQLAVTGAKSGPPPFHLGFHPRCIRGCQRPLA